MPAMSSQQDIDAIPAVCSSGTSLFNSLRPGTQLIDHKKIFFYDSPKLQLVTQMSDKKTNLPSSYNNVYIRNKHDPRIDMTVATSKQIHFNDLS